MKKNELRQYSRNYASIGGDQAIIEVATGMSTSHTSKISDIDKNTIIKLYIELLGVRDQAALSKLSAKEL